MLTNSDPQLNFVLLLGFILALFITMIVLSKLWK